MSDGPHRSLAMRQGWKRVAERGDNTSFALDEVSAAILPALEADCRVELAPAFVEGLSRVLKAQESSLFADDAARQLELLRRDAGPGIGRRILDHAVYLSARGETGLTAGIKSIVSALVDHAARCARQVEEHYYRESTDSRAVRVRERIESSIGRIRDAIEGLGKRVLGLEPLRSGGGKRLKRDGLDEGVELP